MKMKQFMNAPMEQNTYLLYHEKEGYVIDPGMPNAALLSYIDKNEIFIKGILLTHGHADHTGGVKELRLNNPAPVYAHFSEKEILENPTRNCFHLLGLTPYIIDVDSFLEDGQVLDCQDQKIKVLHTPGHTPGSVCFYVEDEAILFSGDTLFKDSIGRTDFFEGSIGKIRNSIKHTLFTLPDHCTVYPGHGQKTSIGYEKRNNPYVKP